MCPHKHPDYVLMDITVPKMAESARAWSPLPPS